MMKKEISGIVISDIHLGHSRNPTSRIIFNLQTEIRKHPSVSIIIIAGDLYERILSFASNDSILSMKFMIWLADFCIKNNIILRVLEGTPSHDFGQALVFDTIFKEKSDALNYKYVADIDTEYIPELDINILYVPDEARPTVATSMADIHKVIKDKVIHIAVMHGSFHYQLPYQLDSSFTESDFDFVKYFIFIGHVHKHNPRGKIVPQGSFDRLNSGEEEPKGYVKFRINPNTGASFQFIENKNAKRFDTIRIDTNDADKAMSILLNFISDYPSDYLRISIPSGSSLDTKLLSDSARKNKITLTFKEDKAYDNNDTDELEQTPLSQFTITPDNVMGLLLDKIDLDNGEESLFDNEMEKLI